MASNNPGGLPGAANNAASSAAGTSASVQVPTANTTSNGADQGSGQQNPGPLFGDGQPGSANQQQQAGPLQGGGAPQPRRTGLGQFTNNAQLSDLTIHYGPGGTSTFHGHKVILASSSHWFHAAFLNPSFIEAGSRELTLHDDDEAALVRMLQACYHGNSLYQPAPPWSTEQLVAAKDTNRILLFQLSVYTVVDKYQAPMIRSTVLKYVRKLLPLLLNRVGNISPAPPQQVTLIDLPTIANKVYEITGHIASPEPLRSAVLDVIMSHYATRPLGQPGSMVHEVMNAAKRTPEFGRDLFLRTMSAPRKLNPAAYLGRLQVVTCPHCHRVWEKAAQYLQPRCIHCGL